MTTTNTGASPKKSQISKDPSPTQENACTDKLTSNTPTTCFRPEPSEHEGKRFEQVSLICSKCSACLAVSKLKGAHMFSAFKDTEMTHVVLKDEKAIGNSIIEAPLNSKKNVRRKSGKYKKSLLLLCNNCGEKVGSRMNGNFPKTEITRRMFDGTACKVSCEEKNGENVIMKVKEWRKLQSSLKYYGFYPNSKAKDATRQAKKKVIKPVVENHQQQPKPPVQSRTQAAKENPRCTHRERLHN